VNLSDIVQNSSSAFYGPFLPERFSSLEKQLT